MVEFILVTYGALLCVFAVLLLLVVRQIGILSLRIGPSGSRTTGEGPLIGADESESVFVKQLVRDRAPHAVKNILVAFVSPHCMGCRVLFPVLKATAREESDHLLVIAVARSLDGGVGVEIRRALGRNVALVENEQLFEEWKVSGTPYCVVLDENRRVAAKGVTNTAEHVESLLAALALSVPTLDDYLEQHGEDMLPQASERPAIKEAVN